MILLHGTTRWRADQIVAVGPNPRFREPGGSSDSDEGFSTYLEAGPFRFGTPEAYSRGKATQFPDEGGPVILEVEVPDEIVARAVNEWFPLSQGLVQFDRGSGFEELLAAWPEVAKSARIRDVL